MVAYIPYNPDLYSGVFTAVIGSMKLSSIVAVDPDYAGYCQVAGAYAQQLDTMWGVHPATQLDIDIAAQYCVELWGKRAASVTPVTTDPINYAQSCAMVIELIGATRQFFVDQGITPPASVTATYVTNAVSAALAEAKTDASAKVAVALTTAAADATTKANNARTVAISTAAADATTKANAAYDAAVSAASTDATTKADAAQSVAIATAFADATTKANTAQANAIATASGDATTKANAAQSTAIAAAATDASVKASTAQANAIAAAATDASSKANTAQANASTDATSKANTAQANAIAAAATDATTKADNAQTNAIAAAATDATTKANSAQTNAIAAAATDATTKANSAQTNAIAAAATDATTKANNAQANAIAAAATDATTKANNAQANAIAAAATDATTKANNAQTAAQTYAAGLTPAMGGDVSGTTNNASVIKLRGATVPTSPVLGDIGKALIVSAAGILAYGAVAPTFAQVSALRATAIDANHIHAWELDEASGASTFADTGSSAQKVALTLGANILTGTVGLFGKCPYFSNDNLGGNVITAGATGLISAFNDLPLTNFTIECWACPTTIGTSAVNAMFGAGDTNGGTLQYAIQGTTAGSMSATLRTTTFINGSSTAAVFNTAGTLGIWHHYAFVYTGTFVYMFVDGEIVGRLAGGSTSVLWTNGTTPKFIIGNQVSGGAPFVGRISKVRMSNIVRTQTYLRSVYQAGMLVAA